MLSGPMFLRITALSHMKVIIILTHDSKPKWNAILLNFFSLEAYTLHFYDQTCMFIFTFQEFVLRHSTSVYCHTIDGEIEYRTLENKGKIIYRCVIVRGDLKRGLK